eukprot:gene2640-281_t
MATPWHYGVQYSTVYAGFLLGGIGILAFVASLLFLLFWNLPMACVQRARQCITAARIVSYWNAVGASGLIFVVLSAFEYLHPLASGIITLVFWSVGGIIFGAVVHFHFQPIHLRRIKEGDRNMLRMEDEDEIVKPVEFNIKEHLRPAVK